MIAAPGNIFCFKAITSFTVDVVVFNGPDPLRAFVLRYVFRDFLKSSMSYEWTHVYYDDEVWERIA